MRGLYRVHLANRRALTSRNVFFQWHFNGTVKAPFMSAGQYQRDKPEEEKGQWTPHQLKSFTSTHLGGDSIELHQPKEGTQERHTAYIAVGSNLGNRINWIEKALKLMPLRGPMRVKRTSSLWETEPMYVLDQENFVNGVIEIETDMNPLTLLDKLQGIEKTLGREKLVDKGPRNIDLDILLYDDIVMKDERLTIPHPLMLEREFVLRPLAELIPGKALNPSSPWKVTQDYLNEIIPSQTPMSTITPLTPWAEPIRALHSNRKTHVMAILNLTPDSFSDGGDHEARTEGELKADYLSSIGQKVDSFTKGGASIIDIGGQSSAPNTTDITAAEEIDRIVPTIKWIRQKRQKSIISVDTYRASVAVGAITAGANIINDISAGQLDPKMLHTMAKFGSTVVLMHMRGTPQTMNTLTDYSLDGLIPTIAKDLLTRVAEAEAAGIRRWRIILDPGIGFAKTAAQNLEVLRRFDELRDWPGLRGFPWLVGSSRKKFIGRITGAEEPKNRTWGTAATVAAAVQGGADVVRVHDVKEMAQVAKMSDAIWRV